MPTFQHQPNGTGGHHEDVYDVGGNMAATIHQSHATLLHYHIEIHHLHDNIPNWPNGTGGHHENVHDVGVNMVATPYSNPSFTCQHSNIGQIAGGNALNHSHTNISNGQIISGNAINHAHAKIPTSAIRQSNPSFTFQPS